MANDYLEGSIILEKLAEFDLLEDFYEAIDSDNLPKAISLMREAQVEEEMIEMAIETYSSET